MWGCGEESDYSQWAPAETLSPVGTGSYEPEDWGQPEACKSSSTKKVLHLCINSIKCEVLLSRGNGSKGETVLESRPSLFHNVVTEKLWMWSNSFSNTTTLQNRVKGARGLLLKRPFTFTVGKSMWKHKQDWAGENKDTSGFYISDHKWMLTPGLNKVGQGFSKLHLRSVCGGGQTWRDIRVPDSLPLPFTQR